MVLFDSFLAGRSKRIPRAHKKPLFFAEEGPMLFTFGTRGFQLYKQRPLLFPGITYPGPLHCFMDAEDFASTD